MGVDSETFWVTAGSAMGLGESAACRSQSRTPHRATGAHTAHRQRFNSEQRVVAVPAVGAMVGGTVLGASLLKNSLEQEASLVSTALADGACPSLHTGFLRQCCPE